jgi:hypothetical protein
MKIVRGVRKKIPPSQRRKTMYLNFSDPAQIIALVVAAMVIAISIPVKINPVRWHR